MEKFAMAIDRGLWGNRSGHLMIGVSVLRAWRFGRCVGAPITQNHHDIGPFVISHASFLCIGVTARQYWCFSITI